MSSVWHVDPEGLVHEPLVALLSALPTTATPESTVTRRSRLRMNRWWRAAQVIGWVHGAVLVVVVVAMALRLPTFAGIDLVVGSFAVAVVLVITIAVVVATWKIRHRARGGLMVLVLYGVIGTALSGQLLAGAIMSAGRIGSVGYVLGPIGVVLCFVITAGVPTVTYVATHYPGAMGRRA